MTSELVAGSEVIFVHRSEFPKFGDVALSDGFMGSVDVLLENFGEKVQSATSLLQEVLLFLSLSLACVAGVIDLCGKEGIPRRILYFPIRAGHAMDRVIRIMNI